MTASQFKKNELVIDAVLRNLEIIGEASNSIPPAIQLDHPDIPWRQMVTLRNFVIRQLLSSKGESL